MTDNRFEELPMMKLKIICILSAIICVSISGNCHASATMVNGTEFSNSVEVRGTRLQLSGAALLRYMFLIDAYTGALYLPEKTDGPNALDDISKHLILEYRVALSSDDFAKATMEKIKGSVSKEAFQRLLPKIKALNRLYKD
ncbi:MAG: chalcone isomerase family protein, partial [Desulfobacter sp.]|uniref:chalcone isomerase family protein n=1 Tax=Desulfobacter sp. TaxID=2294 RepID=UPI001B70DF0B